jgi:multidrug resistance efflux pump
MPDHDTRVLLREVAQPDPAALPVEAAPKVAPETDNAPGAARYRRRVLLVLSSIVLALVLYWASGYFLAYTDDAYVTSDFVRVAPYISGRIVSVNVVDNQTVTKGELLATIDPTPFQLSLNEKRAKKTEAEAQLAVDRDVIAATQAQRDDAAA